MNRLTDIRLHAQQLVAPQFDDPAELIRWMGMVQAQEYGSAKWAVALRLRTPAAAPVEEALREGRILRMHIMRPTWHFIAAEDVRWMLHLSAPLQTTPSVSACIIRRFNRGASTAIPARSSSPAICCRVRWLPPPSIRSSNRLQRR